MMTLEPPRTTAGNAGKTGRVPDAEAWRAWGLSRAGLSRFLRTAQAAVGLEGEVDVLLAGDRTLRRLNRSYRGKDKATDVLSFPAAEELAGAYGGDLAISLDTAKRQAVEQGHALRDEVRVLLLHGLLHLAGMDHEADGGEMAEREGELRGKLRLPNGLIERVVGRGSAVAGIKARATTRAKATAKTDAGVPRCARDDGEKQATAKAEADPYGMTARKTKATARAKAFDAEGAMLKRRGRDAGRRRGVRA